MFMHNLARLGPATSLISAHDWVLRKIFPSLHLVEPTGALSSLKALRYHFPSQATLFIIRRIFLAISEYFPALSFFSQIRLISDSSMAAQQSCSATITLSPCFLGPSKLRQSFQSANPARGKLCGPFLLKT